MNDKKNIGSPDRDRINLNEEYEVQYWSDKFQVTHDALKAAVQAVGHSVKKVEEYLKNNKSA
jgi:hypothetical protein